MIGAEGKGLGVALGTLQRTRLGAAAQAVGIAQGATDYADQYAKERIAFGKPINEFQAIAFKLADMETRTAAARELLYKACSMADRREPDLAKYTSMAKLFASDTAMWVTVEAIQVLGGYGYVTEYPVDHLVGDRAWRCRRRTLGHRRVLARSGWRRSAAGRRARLVRRGSARGGGARVSCRRA